jgi:hypothetical protein
MSDQAINNLSPTELVNGLDPDVIAARLDELDRESQALRVLLRSARARQAGRNRAAKPNAARAALPAEVRHAE